MKENNKDVTGFLPPCHPPVQTVGVVFSTVTGEAPPGITPIDDITGYHYCREASCLTRISKDGPLFCLEHQAFSEVPATEASRIPYHQCRRKMCSNMVRGDDRYCPEHAEALLPESARSKEYTTKSIQRDYCPAASGNPSVLALEEISKFLPELEKLAKALIVISKSISAGETGGTPSATPLRDFFP